jgi:hypothetical protein
LMASRSMQKFHEMVLKEHPNAESALAMMRTVWRFDPTKDLHGVTVYGTQFKKDTGVAIIHAKVDQKFLLDLVNAAPQHKTEKHGKYDLHTWLKDGTKPQYATFFQPEVIVFANSTDELKAALDVLDGTKPNMASNHTNTPVPGVILVAAVKGLGDAQLPLQAPLCKQVDSLFLLVGENEGQVFVHGALKVKDAEVAEKIKAVVDGALAFASLAKMDDAEVRKLIDAVKVTLADNNVVKLDAEGPVDAVWAQIEKEAAKKKAEIERHHAWLRGR